MLSVGCFTAHQHTSISQEQICSDRGISQSTMWLPYSSGHSTINPVTTLQQEAFHSRHSTINLWLPYSRRHCTVGIPQSILWLPYNRRHFTVDIPQSILWLPYSRRHSTVGIPQSILWLPYNRRHFTVGIPQSTCDYLTAGGISQSFYYITALGILQSYNNNNRIQRHNSRFFTISSLHHKLSPTPTLKWPGRNCAQIMCNTLRTYHMQHVMLPAMWYKGTEFKSHLF